MAQTIKLRRSGVEGSVPTTGQLSLGEVAINTFDGRAFIHKSGSGVGAPDQSIEHIVTTNSETTGSINIAALSGSISSSKIYMDLRNYVAGIDNHGGLNIDCTGGTTANTTVLQVQGSSGLDFKVDGEGDVTFGSSAIVDGNFTVNTAGNFFHLNLLEDTSGLGKVVVIDASGIMKFTSSAAVGGSGGDNLGDHTATQDLDMAGFHISGAAAISASATGSSKPSDFIPNTDYGGTYVNPTITNTISTHTTDYTVSSLSQNQSFLMTVGAINASTYQYNQTIEITRIRVKGGDLFRPPGGPPPLYGITNITVGGEELVDYAYDHDDADINTVYKTIWDGTNLTSWATYAQGSGSPLAIPVSNFSNTLFRIQVNLGMSANTAALMNTVPVALEVQYKIITDQNITGGTHGKGANIGGAQSNPGNYAGQIYNIDKRSISFNTSNEPRGLAITVGKGSTSPGPESSFIDFWSPDGTNDLSFKGGIRMDGGQILYDNLSDKRLKENIKSSKKGLDEVLQLKPKEFNFKGYDTTFTGLIAQEVYKIMPEVVKVGENNTRSENKAIVKPWTLDYAKIVPYLINAIKQQQKQIDSLEKKLKKLE